MAPSFESWNDDYAPSSTADALSQPTEGAATRERSFSSAAQWILGALGAAALPAEAVVGAGAAAGGCWVVGGRGAAACRLVGCSQRGRFVVGRERGTSGGTG